MPQAHDSSGKPHERAVAPQRNHESRPVIQPPATAPLGVSGTEQKLRRQEAAEHGGYWPITPEWALVWVTLFLAIYTYRLFRATNTLANDARLAAEKQAVHTEASLAVAVRSADAACQAAAATETSVATMKTTAERQLRAYVMVNTVEAAEKESRQFPMPISYVVAIMNFGQTPAYDVEILADAELAPVTAEDQLTNTPKREGFTSRLPLGPGGEIHVRIDPPKIAQSQLGELINQTRGLYVYGVARYRDAFGHNRTTRFRLRRDSHSHAMIACTEGNDAD